MIPGFARLELFAQKFEEDVADDGGDDGDFKIGGGTDIAQGPDQATLPPGAGAFEFSHEEIGIEEEEDEGNFDHRSQDIFLHGRSIP